MPYCARCALRGGASPACPVRMSIAGVARCYWSFRRCWLEYLSGICMAYALSSLLSDQVSAPRIGDMLLDLCSWWNDFAVDPGHILLRPTLPDPCSGGAHWPGALHVRKAVDTLLLLWAISSIGRPWKSALSRFTT